MLKCEQLHTNNACFVQEKGNILFDITPSRNNPLNIWLVVKFWISIGPFISYNIVYRAYLRSPRIIGPMRESRKVFSETPTSIYTSLGKWHGNVGSAEVLIKFQINSIGKNHNNTTSKKSKCNTCFIIEYSISEMYVYFIVLSYKLKLLL